MLNLKAEIESFGYLDNEVLDITNDKDNLKTYQLYNNAIDDIKAGNQDIAFIKLKKAVSLKNDFYIAKLIIGLYYAKIGEESKAGTLFEDIIHNSKDFGASALKYVRMLNADKNKKSEEIVLSNPKEDPIKKVKTEIKKPVFFLIGLLAGILICIPFLLSDKKVINDFENNSTNKNEIDSYQKVIKSQGMELNDLKKQVAFLENKINQEKINQETTKDDSQDTQNDFSKYLEIVELYNSDEILGSADMFVEFMDNNSLDEKSKDKVSTFFDIVMDSAARYSEDKGVALFEEGKYDESLLMLGMAVKYRPDYKRMYRVTYYTGKNLLAKGEYLEAKEKFLEVINIAPNDDWIVYANLRLNDINRILGTTE